MKNMTDFCKTVETSVDPCLITFWPSAQIIHQ